MTEQPSAEDYSRREAETRRIRPPTDTLPRAIGVFLSGASPRIIAALVGASLAVRVMLRKWSTSDAVIAGFTWLGWPFMEWAGHKWILHLEPREVNGKRYDPLFARRHREHHANPSYFPKVFLPHGVVVGSYLGFTAVLTLLLRDKRRVMTGMTAVSAAALVYEWVHYISHTDYKPKSAFLKRIVRRHRLHHYRNEAHWFGFSVPDIDEWLGTGGEARDVPLSEFTRNLGVEDDAEVGGGESGDE